MANTLKNKKAPPPKEIKPQKEIIPPQANELNPIVIDRKRQTKLGFGIFFLLCGIFTCMAILSYCFTWKIDQDHLKSPNSIFHFLFRDQTPVANICGRMGAALSYILVSKGAGIASLAIGIGIAGIGINMIYGRKSLHVLRYMRWASIALLLLAPVLTYLPHESTFPIGGALGNVAINYMNGLLGTLGTGMVLLSAVLFFVSIVFALDISPVVNRMRKHAREMAESLAPDPTFTTTGPTDTGIDPHKKNDNIQNEHHPDEISTNQLNDEHENIPLIIDNKQNNKEYVLLR